MSFGKYIEKAKEKTAQAQKILRPRSQKAKSNVSSAIARRLKKRPR